MFLVVSCTITDMSGDEWKRVGAQIVQRRIELGMHTRESFAQKLGLSARALGDIEKGRRANFDTGTLTRIEIAISWQPGSIAAALNGKEPVPLEVAEQPPRSAGSFQIDLTAIPGDALIEEIRRRMRTDLEYLSSKPVRRWTGLLELVETTEGDSNDMEAQAQSSASSQGDQGQEAGLADHSEDWTFIRDPEDDIGDAGAAGTGPG